MRTVAGVVLTLWLASVPAQAADLVVRGPAGAKTLSLAQIAALPHVGATLAAEAGGPAHHYRGAPLATLLEGVGGPAGGKLRGAALGLVIVVTGADGYRAVFSLADTDPSISPEALVLADRTDSGPLEAKEGPLRLIVDGDRRPARSVRGVVEIKLEAAP